MKNEPIYDHKMRGYNFALDLAECKSGDWKVSTFVVSQEDSQADRLRSLFGGHGRYCKPGSYHRLSRNGSVVMSNTYDEMRDLIDFIHKAKGRVLIAGLGLGLVVKGLLQRDDIEHITVIEKSQDVITLTAQQFDDPRVEIICADIFEWKPPKGEQWHYGWYDIWDDICADNLPEMGKLHRKFGRRIVVSQDSWCKYLCKQQRY